MYKTCSMRHENGNCLPCGGFCTAVNDQICEAMRNAYNIGMRDGVGTALEMYMESIKKENTDG